MRTFLARAGLAVVALTAACGNRETTSGHEREATASQSAAIQGGKLATTQTFAISMMGRGFCSGTLIAPNLVLTARHCVETEPSSSGDGCENEPLVSASELSVSTASQVTGPGQWTAKRVLPGPPQGKCSPDIALVQLAQNIPASEAKPARPAVDAAYLARPHFSAKVTAIGFGVDEHGEPGTRRIRENIDVLCVPGDAHFTCSGDLAAYVQDYELVAAEGACQGDSGGGLYDQESIDKAAPIVVGVVSRGPVDQQTGLCGPGAYGRVDKFRDFIVAAAKVAAAEGGYPVPDWTTDLPGKDAGGPEPEVDAGREGEADAAPSAAPTTKTTTTTGCTAGPFGSHGSGLPAYTTIVAIAALAAFVRRRKR
jgi:hypothetical protein